jgi:hypothetical protein
MSKHKRHNHEPLPFLAQILMRSDTTTLPCQGVIHQQTEQPATAEWEVRMYQDFDLTQDLLEKNVPEKEINQRIWDLALHEQDTIGIVNHKTLHLCSECCLTISANHAGEMQTNLAMMGAILTGGSFLLVSDHDTEAPGIVTGIEGVVKERDLRESLLNSPPTHIHFNIPSKEGEES